MTNLSCDMVEHRDLVPKYVTGRLSTSDREAFERHYLECETCWRALQQAIEVRAAMTGEAEVVGGEAADVPTSSAEDAAARRWWPVVTALSAAAVVVLAVYLRPVEAPDVPGARLPIGEPAAPLPVTSPPVALPPPPDRPSVPDVTRSASAEAFTVSAVRRDDGGVEVSWRPVPRAAQYLVRVNALDGTPILEREAGATATSLTIPASDLAGRSADERLFVHVEARGATGVSLATSDRIEVRREPGRERP